MKLVGGLNQTIAAAIAGTPHMPILWKIVKKNNN